MIVYLLRLAQPIVIKRPRAMRLRSHTFLIVGVAATAIATLHSPALAVRTAVFFAVLRVIQDCVIYPRLIGRDLHMHPLAVILAVLAVIAR